MKNGLAPVFENKQLIFFSSTGGLLDVPSAYNSTMKLKVILFF